jgi:hypothetical protein
MKSHCMKQTLTNRFGVSRVRKTVGLAALVGIISLTMGALSAVAINIDTTGTDAGDIFNFGAENTATYGQTFTPDSSQTFVTSFSLYLRDRYDGSGSLDLRGYIAAWDGSKAGALLFESGTQTMNAAGTLQEFMFSPNIALTPGAEYVFFLSISDLPLQSQSTFGMPYAVGDQIPGEFVYLNNGTDFSQLFTDNWSQGFIGDGDVWIKANFGAGVPDEGTTMAILALGLAAIVFARRSFRVTC